MEESGRVERMENVEVFKYLWGWFDRGMRGNVHLEKMRGKAEKWGEKIGCMSRVNREKEVDRGRLIWESLARPLEHAPEVWWTGGKAACKNLEKNQ